MRAAADAFRPLFRHQLYAGLGFARAGMQWIRRAKRGRADADYLDLDELLAGYPEEVHVDMLRGAGTYTRLEGLEERRRRGQPDEQLVSAVLASLYAGGDPRAGLVAEGGSAPKEYAQVLMRTPKMLEEAMATLRSLPPDIQPAYARGCGLHCGRLLRREIPAEERLIEKFLRNAPTALAEELLFGLGQGLADGGERPAIPAATSALVPAALRAPVRRGYADGVAHVWGAEAAQRRLAELPPDWQAP
jgi:hypothetical protein